MKGDRAIRYFRSTELTRTNLPALVEQLAAFVAAPAELLPRRYPGYPRTALPAARTRRLCALDATLRARRSATALGDELPTAKALGQILQLGHGYVQSGATGHGMVPSAGGLQALELYLVALEPTAANPKESSQSTRSASNRWLLPGLYHYDRAGHYLSQVAAEPVARAHWEELVPSLRLLSGGTLLWILAGDLDRVARKYGSRAYRFLLLEAGHLMQNLCLLSTSIGLCTVPLGAGLEEELRATLGLPRTDAVLYVGALGVVVGGKGQVK